VTAATRISVCIHREKLTDRSNVVCPKKRPVMPAGDKSSSSRRQMEYGWRQAGAIIARRFALNSAICFADAWEIVFSASIPSGIFTRE
jgi:hypothetical protein